MDTRGARACWIADSAPSHFTRCKFIIAASSQGRDEGVESADVGGWASECHCHCNIVWSVAAAAAVTSLLV